MILWIMERARVGLEAVTLAAVGAMILLAEAFATSKVANTAGRRKISSLNISSWIRKGISGLASLCFSTFMARFIYRL